MSNKKPFSELTKQGQTRRLNEYAKEREARGTVETLARLVKPATFKEIKDGAQLAIFRLAINKKEAKTEFMTATAYVAKGKDAYMSFLESLEKGQLVSVEYKSVNGYNNIYNIIDRSSADKKAKADKAEAVNVQDVELD